MVQISKQESRIILELIKNPRISDNQIAKNTNIPVTTVNRKRKTMEEDGLISYFASIRKHGDGFGIFRLRQMYTIKLRAGITRQQYIEKVEMDPKIKLFNSTFISATYLGEQEGHLAVVVMLDAVSDSAMMDEFNGNIIGTLKDKLGEECIREVTTVRINDTVRLHHNYLPNVNMKNGIIKKDWPEEYLFVDGKDKVNKHENNLLQFTDIDVTLH